MKIITVPVIMGKSRALYVIGCLLVTFLAPRVARAGEVVLTALKGPIEDAASVQPAMDAIANANKAPRAARVIVEIDSTGGNVDDAMRLAKTIERSRVPVTCFVDGDALSAAAIILETCHDRVMTRRSVLMFHQIAISGDDGQPVDLENRAARAWALSEAIMVEGATARSHVQPEEMRRRIDGGRCWFIGWREALKLGLVDRVVRDLSEIGVKP